MFDMTMRAKLLPAPCLIKNSVNGENNCNYEIYLLELLNESKWFRVRYPEGFIKPVSESNGECDAINQNYQIDFKLFAAKTALQARSLLSPQIYKDKDGVIFYCESKKPGGTIKATRLFAALRGMSVTDLYTIRKNGNKVFGVENDIFTMLTMLETKKNLFLFFPYEFTFDKYHNKGEALKSISEALTEDFRVSFEYRERQVNRQYNTFVACIYDNAFLIYFVQNQATQLIDIVETKKVSTFLYLYQYADMW